MTKKIVLLSIIALFCASSCTNSVVEKPKNLVSEDQMVSMLYDLSLLDAIRIQSVTNKTKYPTATEFLKQKYKIDSLTFAKNSQYYASDIPKYKRIYERVKIRLEREKEKVVGKKKEITSEVGIVK